MVVGKPQRRPRWQPRGGRLSVARLVRQSGPLAIDWFQTERTVGRMPRLLVPPAGGWREYVWALGILALVTALGSVIERTIGYPSVPLIYLLALTVGSLP
jgi:hypothetical protein